MRSRLAVLLLSAAPLRAQDPLATRSDPVRPVHDALEYTIAISLPDSGSRISAEVGTRWRLGGPGPIVVDLDAGLVVRRVTVDGASAPWHRAGNTLVIPVHGPAGSRVETGIAYDGAPTGGLIFRGTGATRTVFGDNWPDRARHWLAVQDYPGDKAIVAWRIEAPVGLTVVANGRLEHADTLPGGRVRWEFRNPEPIPTYTMVLGAARFATAVLPPAGCSTRCVPVSLLTYPGDAAFAMEGPFRLATEIVEFFSNRIAPFPYVELRHVESSTRYGGMENATAIFYDEKALRERRMKESTVAHETAHQWFGDAVTEADWHHIWLSEGFADYGAALWTEHVGGDTGIRAQMQRYRTEILASAATERPVLDYAIVDRTKLLNTNSYQKGAWVLHSLRGLMGDSAFFRGLSRYYRAFEHHNALSADFARIMTAETGQDLAWYFDQALTRPGYPVLEVATELDGGHLLLIVRQVQKRAWGLYRIPNLEIRLDDRIVRVDVEGAVTKVATHWPGDRPPASVEVDPGGWWLLAARVAP